MVIFHILLAHPETTETNNRNLTSTTKSSVTASSPTPTGSLDKDKCAGVCNHGVSLDSGFHNLFTFASSFFAMIMLMFPNL